MGDHKSRQIFSSSGVADGDWFFVGDSSYKSLHFALLELGGTIELRSSNKLTKPASGDQEAPLFLPVTSGEAGTHGFFDISQLMTWLRVRKTAVGGAPETTTAVLREGIIT